MPSEADGQQPDGKHAPPDADGGAAGGLIDREQAGGAGDLERIADPSLKDALGAVYPEAIPIGARPSTFDAY